DKIAKALIVLLPQIEHVRQSIGKSADAKLDGAAVFNEHRGMDGGGIVGERNLLLGRGKKRKFELRPFKDMVEGGDRHRGLAFHEGKRRVNLSHSSNVLAFSASLLKLRQEVKRDVSIGAKTESGAVALTLLGDQLADDID